MKKLAENTQLKTQTADQVLFPMWQQLTSRSTITKLTIDQSISVDLSRGKSDGAIRLYLQTSRLRPCWEILSLALVVLPVYLSHFTPSLRKLDFNNSHSEANEQYTIVFSLPMIFTICYFLLGSVMVWCNVDVSVVAFKDWVSINIKTHCR